MKRLTLPILTSFVISVVFLACEFDNLVDLKISEILKIGLANKPVLEQIPATLRIQVSGKEKCQQEKDNIKKILSPYYPKLNDPKCEEEGMKSFLDLQTDVYLSNNQELLNKKDYLFSLYVKQESKGLKVVMLADPANFQSLNSALSDKYLVGVEPGDVSLYLNLVNDSKETLTASSASVYLDGKAAPFGKTISVESGESVKALLSTILVQYLLEEKQATIWKIEWSGEGVPEILPPKSETVEPSEASKTDDTSQKE